MAKALSLFEGARITLDEALDLTAQSLTTYAATHRHWVIAFSGGKDSSATVAVVSHLIGEGRVPPPESLRVLYADTRMELPPLQSSALGMLAELERRSIRTRVVLPDLDDRFFVYMFGRGVPPPSNRFRWCTAQGRAHAARALGRPRRDRWGQTKSRPNHRARSPVSC